MFKSAIGVVLSSALVVTSLASTTVFAQSSAEQTARKGGGPFVQYPYVGGSLEPRQAQMGVRLVFRAPLPSIDISVEASQFNGARSASSKTENAGRFSFVLPEGVYFLRVNIDQMQAGMTAAAVQNGKLDPRRDLALIQFNSPAQVTAEGQEAIASNTYLVTRASQRFVVTIPRGGATVSGGLGVFSVVHDKPSAVENRIH